MQKPQIMGLFPTPVARYSLWARSWQDRLHEFPRTHSGNHSYSDNRRVLDDIPELKKMITQQINDYSLEVLGIQEPLEITQSWINVYNKGDSIHQHNHPNSIVSGTWYWQTEDTELLFHKHGLNSSTTWTMKLDQHATETRPFAIQTNSVRLSENDLILWPSYLQHSFPEQETEQLRCSLSFNSLPKSWGSGLYET